MGNFTRWAAGIWGFFPKTAGLGGRVSWREAGQTCLVHGSLRGPTYLVAQRKQESCVSGQKSTLPGYGLCATDGTISKEFTTQARVAKRKDQDYEGAALFISS